MTPDNQTTELYDPAVFGEKHGPDGPWKQAGMPAALPPSLGASAPQACLAWRVTGFSMSAIKGYGDAQAVAFDASGNVVVAGTSAQQ